jgi:hypothetical protein
MAACSEPTWEDVKSEAIQIYIVENQTMETTMIVIEILYGFKKWYSLLET